MGKSIWNYEKLKAYINSKEGNFCELDMTELEVEQQMKKESKTITKIQLRIKCGSCIEKEIFITSLDSFRYNNKKKCKTCSDKIKLKNLRSNEDELLEKYKKYKSIIEKEKCELLTTFSEFKEEYFKYTKKPKEIKLKIACGTCIEKEVFEACIDNFKKGQKQCKKCSSLRISQKFAKTHEEFVKEVRECLDGCDYEVIGIYKNATTKVRMRHKKCGHEWNVRPSDFLDNENKIGVRCPKCNESKGEQRIRNYLEKNHYNSVPQYTFDDLRGISNGLLKFDNCILDNNNQPILMIEYQGEFHFKPMKARKHEPKDRPEKKLKIQKYHDQLKVDYCDKNNFPLLRIHYEDLNNIEKILENKIIELKIINTYKIA